jgi:hypothetical protein
VTAPRYDQIITAAASGGPFGPGRPAFVVIHSTEGPMSDGNAVALARWFARSKTDGGPGTSATGIFDPVSSVRMLPEQTIPYHVGPAGNPLSNGDEHCGSVNLTTEQWMSAKGQAMLDASAKVQAQRAHYRGWSLAECRWLSLTQVAARTVNGFCTHNDVRLALGGTDHSDPGRNFPYSWYMGRIRAWYQDPVNGGDSDDMAADPEVLAALDRIADADERLLREGFRSLDANGKPSATAENYTIRGINNAQDLTNDKLDAVLTALEGLPAAIAAALAPPVPPPGA